MKRIWNILSIFLIVLTISCSNDDGDDNNINGEWIENSPIENRTELIFSLPNRVTRIDTNGNYQDTYNYRIENDKIYLSSNYNGQEIIIEQYFKQIDNNHMEIGNLYASIGFNETIMTFSKK